MDEKKPRAGWGTTENYSPDQVYTKATDERGHSSYTRLVRIPPAIIEQVESLIASKDLPAYKTVADFYRDAIVHRLAYWRDHVQSAKARDRMSEIVRRVHLEEVTQRYESELEFFERLRERVSTLCERALAMGDTDEIKTYLNRLREDVDPYREPFRSSFLNLITMYEDKIG